MLNRPTTSHMNLRKISPRFMPIEAVVRVPGSKSVANRALICAALAEGESKLRNMPDGDDTFALTTALTALGVRIQDLDDGGLQIVGGLEVGDDIVVDALLAGTTSRFLLALGALSTKGFTVTGQEALRQRPMAELVRALRTLGASVSPETTESLPLTVKAAENENQMGHEVTVRGDISSQYISALMLIAPMLPRGLVINIDGELVSRSYVEMTASVMGAFGALTFIDRARIEISAEPYKGCDYVIEPDFSSAAFPIAAVAVAGGTVRIPQLLAASQQGDSKILDIASAMGLSVNRSDNDVIVSRDADAKLIAYSGDLSDCSDLVPAVAVMCTVADGVSDLDKIGFIRAKESDRLGDLATEMKKMGANISVLEDGLRIEGSRVFHSAIIDPHHDHRLAMALSLLGAKTTGVVVLHSDVVSKSWPSFWDDMGLVVSSQIIESSSDELLSTDEISNALDTVVAFDFDKTLTVRDCVWPFLQKVHGRQHLYKFTIKNLTPILKALRRKDRNSIKEMFVAQCFAERSQDEIESIGAEFADHVLNQWMRADTADALRWHQTQGHSVVLVSASLDPYMIPIAQHIGVDGLLCTRLETINGVYTGKLRGENCRDDQKRIRVLQWLNEKFLDNTGSVARDFIDFAYGDSTGDTELLAMAKNPIWVKRKDVSVGVREDESAQ